MSSLVSSGAQSRKVRCPVISVNPPRGDRLENIHIDLYPVTSLQFPIFLWQYSPTRAHCIRTAFTQQFKFVHPDRNILPLQILIDSLPFILIARL